MCIVGYCIWINITDVGNQGYVVEGRHKYGLKEDEDEACSVGFEL